MKYKYFYFRRKKFKLLRFSSTAGSKLLRTSVDSSVCLFSSILAKDLLLIPPKFINPLNNVFLAFVETDDGCTKEELRSCSAMDLPADNVNRSCGGESNVESSKFMNAVLGDTSKSW